MSERVPPATPYPDSVPDPRTVALITLGCARNDVDADELAARLVDDGYDVVTGEDPTADVVLVNTCGFVTAAKQESIDTILGAEGNGRPVVAVGCLAERYGRDLAAELPEVAVVGFDGYATIGDTVARVLAGETVAAHEPVDRRTLLPITPVDRPGLSVPPGHTPAVDLPGTGRHRLHRGPVAPVKIASGCDRRCAFCAIPRFRGAFVSRTPDDIVAEVAWLAAEQGVREIVLVSENSTSYGKDLRDPRLLETLLPALAAVPPLARIRLSYLQPAETRESLLDVMAATPKVAPYFDLSFQHASGSLLRRMRRFGDAESFLALIAGIRNRVPAAGIRTNVIVGFPGETEADVAVLMDFLGEADLDAVGVFAYSDEDGTEAADLPGKVDDDEVRDRAARVAALADAVSAGRAAARTGEAAEVLVEHVTGDGIRGRCGFQGPEDGDTVVLGGTAAVGDLLAVVVADSDGVDLIAQEVP